MVIIAILVFALMTENHYNCTFLLWTIFISFIYFAYKSRLSILVVIILCSIAVLFNPFKPFVFNETTWRIIDFIVCISIIISLDWKEYKETLSEKGKLVYNLVKTCFWCFIVLFFVCSMTYLAGIDSFHEFLLMKNGITSKGYVTYAKESSMDSELQGERYDYEITFNFNTDNGVNVKSNAECIGRIPNKYKNLDIHPYQIEIIYLRNDPSINIPNDQISKNIGELLRKEFTGMSLLLLLITLPTIFVIITNAIKKYSKSISNITDKTIINDH